MRGAMTAFISGLVFALGLSVSGMTLPDRVVGFLDVTGTWDPTLAFVMIGAIGIHWTMRRWLIARGVRDPAPAKRQLDVPLLVGSAMFGAGWGLSGYCPGPALVSVGSGAPSVLVFVAAMAAGMWIWQLVQRASPRSRA